MEDMVHRNPADPSTLAPMEQPFAVARSWVAGEREAEDGDDAGGSGAGPSFTRVVIGDLKPDVLRQIMDDEAGTHICQVGGGTGGEARMRIKCRMACGLRAGPGRTLAAERGMHLPGYPLMPASLPLSCLVHLALLASAAGAGPPVPLLPAWRAGEPHRRRQRRSA